MTLKTDSRVVAGLGSLLLSGVLLGQTAGGAAAITAPRPLEELANVLEASYGKPVTYEDSVREWREDMALKWGSDERFRLAMIPKTRTFRLPQEVQPLGSAALNTALLERIIEVYHSDNPDGPRFGVIQSRYGLHIVPREANDAGGHRISVASLLDTPITIPRAKRTPEGHIQAITAAISAQSGVEVQSADMWFDAFYAPNGLVCRAGGNVQPGDLEACSFEWGMPSMLARDALVNLLEGSATTITWRLLCNPSVHPENRFCVLGVGPIKLSVKGADGKPVARQLEYDRCVKCPALKEPPPAPPVKK